MKHSTLLALTAALLLGAGSAFAGPNCKKGNCPDKEGSAEEGVYEVADRDGDSSERPKRERPDEGERKHRGDGKGPFSKLDLSDDQKAQIKEIREAAHEKAKALIEAAKENDERPDREAMMAIRKESMKNVYDNVLTDEQRAKVDAFRKKMEEGRKNKGERKGKDGNDGENRERPKRGGDSEDLDL